MARVIKTSRSPAEKSSHDIVSSVVIMEPLTVVAGKDGVRKLPHSENSQEDGDSMTTFGSEHWADEIDWTPKPDDDYEVDWQ